MTVVPALRALLVPALLILTAPAMASDETMLDRAMDAAIATFERALPRLDATLFGVDVAAYRDALTLQRFASAHWGGAVSVDLSIREAPTGSCGRYAAFVRIPPEHGAVRLVLCPQFFSSGADALRELTVLHEMVHAVAGPDECRAMAFAAQIEQLANGQFTPVTAYWQASGCAESAFQLP